MEPQSGSFSLEPTFPGQKFFTPSIVKGRKRDTQTATIHRLVFHAHLKLFFLLCIYMPPHITSKNRGRQSLRTFDNRMEGSRSVHATPTFTNLENTMPPDSIRGTLAFAADWSQDLSALTNNDIYHGFDSSLRPFYTGPFDVSVVGLGEGSRSVRDAPVRECLTNPQLDINNVNVNNTNNSLYTSFTAGEASIWPTSYPNPESVGLMSNIGLNQPGDRALNPQHAPAMAYTEPPSTCFKCEWNGCPYTGTFRRTAELLRHVKNTHVEPNTFKCPVIGCNSVFKRKDNLRAHVRRMHSQMVG